MTDNTALSPEETALFQALTRPAIVYMLMLRLDRPIGAREVSDILGIDEQTAAKYLRTLSRLNLVARTGRKQGYVLLGGRQLFLGEMREPLALPEPEDHLDIDEPEQSQDTTKISHYSATTTAFKLINNINDSEEVVVDSETTKNSQYKRSHEYDQVWRELIAAGIGPNKRTQDLVRQPHITPEYIKSHRLQMEASGKSFPRWAGLLVTILERGEPAPGLNPNGHLGSCDCIQCHRYKLNKSWGDFLGDGS